MTLLIIFNIAEYLTTGSGLVVQFSVFITSIAACSCLVYALATAAHTVQHIGRGDFWLNALTTRILGMSDESCTRHWHHHRYFGTPKDPDFRIYGRAARSREEVYKIILDIVSLKSGICGVLAAEHSSTSLNLKTIGAQAIVFLTISAFCGWKSYIFIFIPSLLGAKVLNDLRVFTEHFPAFEDSGPVTRNFKRETIFDSILGSHGFLNHRKHHQTPQVNCNHGSDGTQGYLAMFRSIVQSYPSQIASI